MATYKEITVCKMTSANSSLALVPTLAEIGSATGLFINCNHIDASRMILVFTKDASGVNSGSKERIKILHGGSSAGYSAYGLGTLSISALAALNSTKPATGEVNCNFAGPFETARFKDSNGYIKIFSSNNSNVKAIGAILI